jgi:hypothetical protein
VIARVECRSEGAAEQRPVAVWFAGDRIEVAEILDDAIVGPVEAGGVNRRQLRVLLDSGQELLLERELPRKPWRVYRG